MKKTLCTLAIAMISGCGSEGMQGPAGPTGPEGKQGPPGGTSAGIATVQPSRVFLGREVTVQIGGNNTNFAEGRTTVDFNDPAIKVTKTVVASPTLVQVDVIVGPSLANLGKLNMWAKMAAHDITVTTDGNEKAEVVSAKGIFMVDSPVNLQVLNANDMPGGELMQGAVAPVNLINLDYVHNPFVISPGSLFTPPEVVLEAALLESGVLSLSDGTGTAASGLALIDVKAAKAPNFAAVGPSPFGTDVAYVLPAGVEKRSPQVKERAAEDLPIGMAKMGKITQKYGTSLYKIPAQAMAMGEHLLFLSFTKGMGSTIAPAVSVLGDSGKWNDGISVKGGTAFAAAGGPIPYFGEVTGGKEFYAVVYDSGLKGAATGYEYSVTAQAKALYVPAMYTGGGAVDKPNTQIDFTKGPTLFKTPALKDALAVDYFEFKMGANNNRVHVVTSAPDPKKDRTDVTIDVRKDNCKGNPVLPRPVDRDYYESTSFDAEASKTYCVIIGISPDSNVGGPYKLLVTPNL